MKVVIVESPAKAKTINKYLGDEFKVIASMGHVRDLTAKTGSVDVDHDFAMTWEISGRAEKTLKEIGQLVSCADELILATDPDREGEAIAWHVLQVLQLRKVLSPNIPVKRVVFHEITASAIREAVNNPRTLDHHLIDAYLARRALDYLVGFTLSPVLWRKLPGSKSAGRVQSVALRLITEREIEIESFRSQEYWTVEADLAGASEKVFLSKLTHLHGKKLDKFSLTTAQQAQEASELVQEGQFRISSVEKKETQRHPTAPFTTSTVQQEAARKLGFSTTRTMRTAQQLYEGVDLGEGERTGIITYMRTDSVNLAQEAVTSIRAFVGDTFGSTYVSPQPRLYKSKAKNTQEAHEAIRPTDVSRQPDALRAFLNADQHKLYALIWKRTVACQMATAIFDQVIVDAENASKTAILHASGSTLKFDGFLKVYQEGKDDEEDTAESDRRLPPLEVGESVTVHAVRPLQHFTAPPPRYTEASMVKQMEELGIGRPSTYSAILQTLQDRDYVLLEKKRFSCKDRGRIVIAFLTNFFAKYVEYGFTADMEESLDAVSNGTVAWKDLLGDFWVAFKNAIDQTQDLTMTEVIDRLDHELELMLFPQIREEPNARQCTQCSDGRLGLKLGRYGAFIGCTNYPTCGYTRKLILGGSEEGDTESAPEATEAFETRDLGVDPQTGDKVTLRKGPYGFYFQWGEATKGARTKPRRMALPAGQNPHEVDLTVALAVPQFPKVLGAHPVTGDEVSVGAGRFGPYVKYLGKYTSVKGGTPIETLSLDEAVEILNQKKEAPPRTAATVSKTASKATSKPAAKKAPAESTPRKRAPRKA